mmetsp:Transcript_28549/g.78423  ORF Transcript_28549/g.78423 Transcript_28549/m.78423 type:complete len:328 (+) Transcript_28549:91-1074(+)
MVFYNNSKKKSNNSILLVGSDCQGEGSVSSTELVAPSKGNNDNNNSGASVSDGDDNQSQASRGSHALNQRRTGLRRLFGRKSSSSLSDEGDASVSLPPITTISVQEDCSSTNNSTSCSSISISNVKKVVTFAPQEQEHRFLLQDDDNNDSDEESMYYLSYEMKLFRSQAQQLARTLAAESELPQHLAIAYGLEAQQQQQPSSSDNEEDTETITPERAMANYYKYMQRETRHGSDNNMNNNLGSCRGLERRLCSSLEDDAKDAVQAVLAKQNELRSNHHRRNNNSNNKKTTSKSAASLLAQESCRASAQAKRFARLLGKGDEAMAKKQ